MIKNLFVAGIFFVLIFSCEKMELSDIEPVIELKVSEGFVYSDTSISAGKQYTVGIIANSEGGENITNLIVESNGIRILDLGFNFPEISKEIILTKTNDEIEKIDFIIRNKARKADTISITISKLNIAYSPIKRYSSVIIGAQNSSAFGNYFSFSNAEIYTQAQAFVNQEIIDLVFYFDAAGDGNTFASPGANLSGIISGSDSPEFWTTKRTSRFSRLPIFITDEEFNSAQNDSLIIAHLFTDGGRKAKLLQNGQYYGIQNNENKYGILKIENVIGQAEGNIQFSLIIQQ